MHKWGIALAMQTVSQQDMPFDTAFSLLEWYRDIGFDEVYEDEAQPFFNRIPARVPATISPVVQASVNAPPPPPASAYLTKATDTIIKEAEALAKACDSLEDLKKTAQGFEGLSLRKHAASALLGQGAVPARILFLSDAPSAEDDRSATAYSGAAGSLLANISRAAGWSMATDHFGFASFFRPPGGRLLNSEETAVSAPFLTRYIQLVSPRMLVLTGSAAVKMLLDENLPLSKLRHKRFTYTLADGAEIPCHVTLGLEHLLNNPAHKAYFWEDALNIMERLKDGKA